MEEAGFEIVVNDKPVWITNEQALALCPDAAKRILNAAHAMFSAIEQGASQETIEAARRHLIHRHKQFLTTLTAKLDETGRDFDAIPHRSSQ
jgi:hypothetical protein